MFFTSDQKPTATAFHGNFSCLLASVGILMPNAATCPQGKHSLEIQPVPEDQLSSRHLDPCTYYKNNTKGKMRVSVFVFAF